MRTRMGSVYVMVCSLIIIAATWIAQSGGTVTRPNIVFIIADDLGWDDVSFHGSDQILTPNIDLLAYTGVAFERYYSHCICTPSRSALLTGKYSHTMGMQGYPLTNGEDRALPLNEKILPQYLKELGYATHLVGKWHLGQSRTPHLPTSRGFDSHFGHRGGYVDYYEYTLQETWNTDKVSGLALFRNLTAAWDAEGYVTDIYTEEAKTIIQSHDESTPLFLMVAHNAPHSADDGALLQAPPEYVRAMRHVELSERRIYAAMVKKLDDSVGDIVGALLEKGILNNTLIAFVSDNGGMTSGDSRNYAINWPLRGLKMSPFEGGMRVVGLLWSPVFLTNQNHLWQGYMHVTDWLPTLFTAIGAEPPSNIDGVDHWNSIISNSISERQELFEIDDYTGYASIISNNYKLMTGTVNMDYCNYQGGDLRGVIGIPPNYTETLIKSNVYKVFDTIGKTFNIKDIELRNRIRINCKKNATENTCYPQDGKWCLFDIKEDPCEKDDLSKLHPDIVDELLSRLQVEMKRTIPRTVPIFRDPRSAPRLHNYTWDVWANNIPEA